MTSTALVVEDDDWVRMVAVEALTDEGFQVIEAAHADAALTILNVQSTYVDVLITDVSMPGDMGGLALARHVFQHWEWIGILIVSARPLAHLLMPPNSRFLAKPYSITDLAKCVRALTAL